MKRIILTFILVLSSIILCSQAKVVERVELKVADAETGSISNFQVFSLKKNGLINIYFTRKGFQTPVWHFDKYSTSLSKTKSELVEIPKSYKFSQSYSTPTHFYILMKKGARKYKLIGMDFATMDVKIKDGDLLKKAANTDLTVLNGTVYLNSTTRKECFLTAIDWSSGKTRVIPIAIKGAKSKTVRIKNIQALEKTKELFVVIQGRIQKDYQTHIVRIDESGKIKDRFDISKKLEEDKQIIDVTVSSTGEDEYIYSGTYGKGASSNGIFVAKSIGNKLDFLETYNFLDLTNFLSYLSARKVKKVARKKKRKEKRGKELEYYYNIASHDIIKKGDKYIFIGEAYYPTYRTETTYVTNADGTSTTRTRQVFDGYQYTHAVVASFDNTGQLLWDNTFELYSAYKPFYVKQFISVSEAKDEELNMVFTSGRYIHTKAVNQFNGKTIKENKSELQTTDDSSDKVKRSHTDSDYWYGNTFLTYGYQKVKNTSGKGKKRRRVYFINKIEF